MLAKIQNLKGIFWVDNCSDLQTVNEGLNWG